MKNTLLIITVTLFSLAGWSQENIVTLSGGYAFANLEETDNNATGWRINGLYEFNPGSGSVSHGVSFGYIGTSASNTTTVGTVTNTVELKLNTWPIYYAPKFMIGGDKLKGFIKGALGMHFSGYKIEGSTAGADGDTNDAGFYGGASLGGIYNLSDVMFLNLEYEWAYLSNSYYRDGFMNSAMIGVGMKF